MVTRNLEYFKCPYMFLMKTENILIALKILYEEHFENSELEHLFPTRS